ncbi:MAG: hypothetical protein EA389_03910 [Ilumatobacter sp.]|nr:MAG: hypothetical protein EA389_03910 [Ilumatobacter sp.]
MQRPDGTLVGLLGEIVGGVGVAQMTTQSPHVGLCERDEPLERVAVAVPGVQQQSGEGIHPPSISPGTSRHTGSTVTFMEASPPDDLAPCHQVRELVSAAADDEVTRHEQALLEAHLADCAGCRDHADRVAMLTRRARLRRVEPVPDMTQRVFDRARPPRLGRGGWLRPALAWVAIVIAAQSLGPLVFGEVEGAPTHVARHLGAFAFALAIGLLYAAWRPHRAFGLLPFAGALVVTMSAGAVFDLASGSSTVLAESVHLAELLGLGLLWMISGSPGWERVSRRGRPLVARTSRS